ncbi:MAG TPA: hypothetical protein VGA37_02120 [Gemmatimonadales bacterium]
MGAEVIEHKEVKQTLRKQRKNGLWGDNILGLTANRAQGIKDTGTVATYRRLLEFGVPPDDRAYRQADRVLYRALSRDPSSELLFEYKAAAKTNTDLANWARRAFREGATVALAQAGRIEDPRVRGAAHRIATDVSQFLRSDLVDKPIIKKNSRHILHPDAQPPTTLSVALFSYMPNIQRERAGFLERLCAFLAQPQPKRTYTIAIGRKIIQPTYQLLGNPIEADRSGNAKDVPLALHWIELLARLGMLHTNEVAQRVLGRLLSELDANGVWSPHNLRAIPKSPSRLADFAFPLEADARTMERRQADVTFRLALIAKIAGWELEYT